MLKNIWDLIDEAKELAQDDGFRNHLGGSLIGRKCERELVYSWRWATRVVFSGRMLRLFERGQNEEAQFVKDLRSVGVEVREFSESLMYHAESDSYVTIPNRRIDEPPTEPQIEAMCDCVTDEPFHVARAKARGVEVKQWRVADLNGHFGGSLDGLASRFPRDAVLPEPVAQGQEVLLEFKTHGTRSFDQLVLEKSVRKAKLEHWAQMQVYMHYRGLKWGLYNAVHKNNDERYGEWIPYDREGALELIEKAKRVVYARKLPPRLSNHPSWYECRFCDHKKKCHHAEPLERHCRSCVNAIPVENGQWHCAHWQSILPSEFMRKSCENYEPMTD